MNYPTILLTTDILSDELLRQYVPFTQVTHNPDLLWLTVLPEKSSIGIDQIHILIDELALKPFREDRKVAIIKSAHLLTLPAQQSLLKTLEEPPDNTQIILATPLPGKLLPTILSRTLILRTEREDSPTDTQLYESLTGLSISACISKSDEWGKSKEESLAKLTELIAQIRCRYLAAPTLTLLRHERSAIHCLELLEKNVNVKLALDQLFFQLSS